MKLLNSNNRSNKILKHKLIKYYSRTPVAAPQIKYLASLLILSFWALDAKGGKTEATK